MGHDSYLCDTSHTETPCAVVRNTITSLASAAATQAVEGQDDNASSRVGQLETASETGALSESVRMRPVLVHSGFWPPSPERIQSEIELWKRKRLLAQWTDQTTADGTRRSRRDPRRTG